MWLIFGSTADLSAIWAFEGLSARGLAPVQFVSGALLASSLTWEHRIGAGGAHVKISLADGRTIESASVRGVLNRLTWFPYEHVSLAHPADRDYACQELAGFYTSWLYAMPKPVLNRPTPLGMAGAWRHPSEWARLAGQAGLSVPIYRQDSRNPEQIMGLEPRLVPFAESTHTVFVVGEYVFSEAADMDRIPHKVCT